MHSRLQTASIRSPLQTTKRDSYLGPFSLYLSRTKHCLRSWHTRRVHLYTYPHILSFLYFMVQVVILLFAVILLRRAGLMFGSFTHGHMVLFSLIYLYC
ncbi:hypothetical protein BJX76DRAFT_194983 [Aspergillus varians]